MDNQEDIREDLSSTPTGERKSDHSKNSVNDRIQESLFSTPTGERLQIGIFGKVNAGKSSILNAITDQDIAIVSKQEGTTTDPVRKAMELLPIGPVMIYDTPGLSDGSALGEKRIGKTEEVLRRIDVGLLVISVDDLISLLPNGRRDPSGNPTAVEVSDPLDAEHGLLEHFRNRNLPILVILNKTDRILQSEMIETAITLLAERLQLPPDRIIAFSCKTEDVAEQAKGLREKIAQLPAVGANDTGSMVGTHESRRYLVADLLNPGDVVILVIPIDESAPKGRLILPQQQVIRDALEAQAIVMAVKPRELTSAIAELKRPPKLVITDSQAFEEVAANLSEDIPLTSFSMLMARYKGDLAWQAAGAARISELPDGAWVLISEGCTHHRQCGDIGTVKLPAWIEKYTGRQFHYEFTSGGEFPKDLSRFGLVIHCGGCTLPPREMAWRITAAREQGVPITNYGTMIAYLHGILERAMAPLELN